MLTLLVVQVHAFDPLDPFRIRYSRSQKTTKALDMLVIDAVGYSFYRHPVLHLHS